MPRMRAGFAFLSALVLLAACSGTAKVDVSGQIQHAWDEYRIGHFNEAAAQFQAARDAAATDDERIGALYGLGTTTALRRPGEDLPTAQRCFEQVIALDAQHVIAGWSRLSLARLKHLVPPGQEPDYVAVRAAYQECIDRHPGHLAAQQAFLYQQATLLIGDAKDDARAVKSTVQAFIAAHPDSPFLSAAWKLVSQCCGTLRLFDEGLAAQIAALESREFSRMAPIDLAIDYWNIATVAEFDVGDFATARAYYRKLLDEYPLDQRRFASKAALQRMDDLEATIRAEQRK
jgi:tetratricopeptide (TPR) repeat protein